MVAIYLQADENWLMSFRLMDFWQLAIAIATYSGAALAER